MNKFKQKNLWVMIILMGFMFCLCINLVSATWSNTTFNNSLSFENITFFGSQNVTRYLEVPSTTTVTSAYMNLSAIDVLGEIREYYRDGDKENNFYEQYLAAQTFTVGTNGSNTAFYVGNISLKMRRSGSPGLAYIYIYAVDGSSLPTGSALASGTFDATSDVGATGWYNFSLNSSVELQASTEYAIVLNLTVGDGSNGLFWQAGNPGNFSEGLSSVSEDYGATWSPGTLDNTFEVYRIDYTPTNPYLDVGNADGNYEWNASDGKFLSMNKTSNLASAMNNYLKGCTLIGAFCYVPFLFHSDSAGLLQYFAMTFDNDGFLENSQTYTTPTTEGNNNTFIINISYDNSSYSNVISNLYYNNSATLGTKSGSGSNVVFTVNKNAPSVNSNQSIDFYWAITLSNSSGNHLFNSTSNSQYVNNIGIDTCAAHSTILLNMTLLDEEAQEILDGDKTNSTVLVDLKIYSIGDRSFPIISLSQNFTELNISQVCIDNDLVTSSYEMNIQIQYDADGYASEFYNIQNKTITNSSIPQQIKLFDLKDSSSQAFKITYKDESFLAVEDAIVQIQRKYIDEGVFKTVEQPKTDVNGETIAHLQVEEAIYTIIFSKQGKNLATFSNIIAVCQNPALETCEINLNSFATSISPKDYTVGDDFVFTLTFEKSTREIESIFSIPSGTSAVVNLNVTLYDNLGTTEACSESLTSSSGTLNCIVPQALGNGTVIAKVTKDGNLVGQAYIDLSQEPEDLYGLNLVFISLFLMMTLIGIGISDNPMITGFFILIGAILAIALNLVDTGTSSFIGAGATVLWLVIALVIVLVKGAKRT